MNFPSWCQDQLEKEIKNSLSRNQSISREKEFCEKTESTNGACQQWKCRRVWDTDNIQYMYNPRIESVPLKSITP